VQRYVENPLSKRILAGDFVGGDEVVVDADDSGLTFDKPEPAAVPAAT
jgi:ATP-dependent Clp protease ATP-binding subunit ClpA